MASMPHLIRTLPKVELHLHLETSLRLRRLLGQQHPDDPTIADPHLIADPGAFTGYDRLRRVGGRRGFTPLGVRPMLEAMAEAAAAAEPGVHSAFLVTVVRERGPEEAEAIVTEAAACWCPPWPITRCARCSRRACRWRSTAMARCYRRQPKRTE